MEKQAVEKTLDKTLRDGEQVLWSGKTEAFPLLTSDARGIIAAVVGMAALLRQYMEKTA